MKSKQNNKIANSGQSSILVVTSRQWISKKLVKIAIKLWPKNPLVSEFYAQMFEDLAITGKFITRVDPKGFHKRANRS